jgi:hypothetical protein
VELEKAYLHTDLWRRLGIFGYRLEAAGSVRRRILLDRVRCVLNPSPSGMVENVRGRRHGVFFVSVSGRSAEAKLIVTQPTYMRFTRV